MFSFIYRICLNLTYCRCLCSEPFIKCPHFSGSPWTPRLTLHLFNWFRWPIYHLEHCVATALTPDYSTFWVILSTQPQAMLELSIIPALNCISFPSASSNTKKMEDEGEGKQNEFCSWCCSYGSLISGGHYLSCTPLKAAAQHTHTHTLSWYPVVVVVVLILKKTLRRFLAAVSYGEFLWQHHAGPSPKKKKNTRARKNRGAKQRKTWPKNIIELARAHSLKQHFVRSH